MFFQITFHFSPHMELCYKRIISHNLKATLIFSIFTWYGLELLRFMTITHIFLNVIIYRDGGRYVNMCVFVCEHSGEIKKETGTGGVGRYCVCGG